MNDEMMIKLRDYVTEQLQAGYTKETIKQTLLDNEWQSDTIDQVFASLGAMPQTDIPPASDVMAQAEVSAFAAESITMDKIIDKFIPIVGALFLIIGFGYLIYANAWVNLAMETRIGLGLFFSVAIIGASFSFSERMNYLADVGIGSGILLFYGTLVYGSRATELASAFIPEAATLVTAALFTLAVAYFASKRNSKVILMLGMVGAYITPFVIGQNGVWVENVSFNAYLIYFLAVNVAVFMIGREISVRDIIPLNTVGMFLGVTTLWGLASGGMNADQVQGFFSSEIFTAFLFMLLTVFSIWSILLSATRFAEKDDGYLSLGYLAPIVWFFFNVNALDAVDSFTSGMLYAMIAVACYTGWYTIRDTETKYQHTALYSAGLLSGALAIFSLFDDFNIATSMLVSYGSLVFAFLYMFASGRSERFVSYMVVSCIGAIMSLVHILDANVALETPLIVIALLPAMVAVFVAQYGRQEQFIPFATMYSIGWSIVAGMFILAEFIEYLDIPFLFFYLIPLALLSYVALGSLSHDDRSTMLRVVLVWFGFGFVGTFLSLVVSIYPAPTDTSIFNNVSTDWTLINGIFATVILFLGLYISRALQAEQVIKRPSFILVIFGFATMLLTGNYIISALMNDLQVGVDAGGPRAIATTVWWVLIAIYMLFVGMKWGKKYHSEKLLGLILLGITVIKVIVYDISTMGMQNKIIVLMTVGGALLLFSYYVRSKNMVVDEGAPSQLGQ